MTARVAIRKRTRDGVAGYSVTLYDGFRTGDYAPRVWVETYRAALRCREAFRKGESPTVADMRPLELVR